jgi:hypothetical protein
LSQIEDYPNLKGMFSVFIALRNKVKQLASPQAIGFSNLFMLLHDISIVMYAKYMLGAFQSGYNATDILCILSNGIVYEEWCLLGGYDVWLL